jgi:hypothetical protein
MPTPTLPGLVAPAVPPDPVRIEPAHLTEIANRWLADEAWRQRRKREVPE